MAASLADLIKRRDAMALSRGFFHRRSWSSLLPMVRSFASVQKSSRARSTVIGGSFAPPRMAAASKRRSASLLSPTRRASHASIMCDDAVEAFCRATVSESV